jgi:Zn-finger nucleic acid-binding protein
MMFLGAKFCSHCGASAARAVAALATPERCPRCRVDMKAVVIGDADLRECPKCEGLWSDKDTLQQIYTDREKQAAVLGMPQVLKMDLTGNVEQNIRYVPCPVCKALMNRVNFSRCSHVIVDVCAKHGTWFDKDELRRVVEFIRAGGMDRARSMEMDELERRRRQLDAARASGGMGEFMSAPAPSYDGASLGVSVVASVLDALLD